jgi:hypothetical protein
LTVLGPDEYRRFPSATGRSLPGIDVRVVDQQGLDVTPGTVGEIVTAGPHVFDGYLNAPQQTAEALHDGRHWTGDLATIDEHGIISVVGRLKDMIITGGFNVYAREVEDMLEAHSAIAQAPFSACPIGNGAKLWPQPSLQSRERTWTRKRSYGTAASISLHTRSRSLFVSSASYRVIPSARSKKHSCEKCSHQNNRYQFNSVRESNLHG